VLDPHTEAVDPDRSNVVHCYCNDSAIFHERRRMMNRSTPWGVRAGAMAFAAMGVLLLTSEALAQKPAGKKDEGYGYEFTDDPLSAGGFGPNDATIRVRPGPVRTTLIRPRTSFVPEMLKSVENL
jgi:hypothetical protein